MALLRRRPGRHEVLGRGDINRTNVEWLTAVWSWKPGEKPLPEIGTVPGSFENTPRMIDNVLYVSTPSSRVVALDADSGREIWSFDRPSMNPSAGAQMSASPTIVFMSTISPRRIMSRTSRSSNVFASMSSSSSTCACSSIVVRPDKRKNTICSSQ